MDSPSFNVGLKAVIDMYVLHDKTVQELDAIILAAYKKEPTVTTNRVADMFEGMHYAVSYIKQYYEPLNLQEAICPQSKK